MAQKKPADGASQPGKKPSAKGKTAPAKPKRNPQKAVATREITTENLSRLLAFDSEILSSAPLKKPAEIIIGTDEVGRGCLAGPVVACAVVLPAIDPASDLGKELARLNDSKLVPPVHREVLAEKLRSICQFAIGEASVEEIDEINILQASLLAMRRAIRRLKVVSPAVILIDGNKKIPSLHNIEQITVVGGDSKSASIAAASVIAKVHRDAFMRKLARKFPQYGWDSNKGYRSRDHWAAINEHGKSVWHRTSFIDHWVEQWNSAQAAQEEDALEITMEESQLEPAESPDTVESPDE